MSINSSPPDAGGSIWSKPVTVWSTILIVVIVLAAIVLAIATSSQNQSPSHPVTSPTKPVVDHSDSICGLPAGNQSIPTTAGPDAVWELVGKIAAPSEPKSFGPGVTADNGVRSCYAHSPYGALFAAANLYAQGSSPDLARPSFEKNVLEGPGRDAALAAWRNPSPSSTSIQVAGFTFIKYEKSRAVIDVAVQSGGNLISYVTELVWSDGDWKFVVQDNGQPPVPPKQLRSLTGYVAWSGA